MVVSRYVSESESESVTEEQALGRGCWDTSNAGSRHSTGRGTSGGRDPRTVAGGMARL